MKVIKKLNLYNNNRLRNHDYNIDSTDVIKNQKCL